MDPTVRLIQVCESLSFAQFEHKYVGKYVNARVCVYIYIYELTDFDDQASFFFSCVVFDDHREAPTGFRWHLT